jgi:hypothetical protein
MMAADSGQHVERVANDYWMSASEARDYGVVDTIVGQTDATAAADRGEAAVQQESAETARKSMKQPTPKEEPRCPRRATTRPA